MRDIQSLSCLEQFSAVECGWQVGTCGFCAYQCDSHAGFQGDLGNGECQEACDNEACSYDDGDCVIVPQGFCSSGCFESMLSNGNCDAECFTLPCHYDEGDCSDRLCGAGCWPAMADDGHCDAECYAAECAWDGRDCDCAPGCFPALLDNLQCDEACATAECGYDGHKCVGTTQGDCAAHCFPHMLGDGHCDEECYSSACDWDALDCGCAAGCRYSDLATCKPECMVPSCGFGRVPGYTECSSVLRVGEIYYSVLQLYYYDFYPTTHFEPAKCNPNCPLEQSFSACIDGDPCWTMSCVSNFGNCYSSPYCEKETYSGACFECKEPLVNSAGVCQESCVEGLQLYPLTGNLCLLGEDESTPDRPDVFYVNDEGEYTEVGQRLSFPSIAAALQGAKQRHTRILLSSHHFLAVTEPSGFLGSANTPTRYFTFTDRTVNLTLSPACSDCPRPQVRLDPSDPPQFVFGGQSYPYIFCDNPVEGTFTVEGVDFVMDSAISGEYLFFVSVMRWHLVLRNVSFRGVKGYTSLFRLTRQSNMTLVNADFADIETSKEVVSQGPELCGVQDTTSRVQYSRGTVTGLRGSSFLVTSQLALLQFDQVEVDNCEVKSAFLSVSGSREVVLEQCRFDAVSVASGSIFQLEPILDYQVDVYTGFYHFGLPDLASIVIKGCSFRWNRADSNLQLDFGGVPQSTSILNCSFSSQQFGSLISVKKETPVSKADIYGKGSYALGTRVNADPFFLRVGDVEVWNVTSEVALISVANLTHVTVSGLSVTSSAAPVLLFAACYNVTVRQVSIARQTCPVPAAVVQAREVNGGMRLSASAIANSTAVTLAAFTDSETVTVAEVVVSRCGGNLLIGFSRVGAVTMEAAAFEHNTAGEVVAVNDTARYEVRRCRFSHNNAVRIILLEVSLTETELVVADSSFAWSNVSTAVVDLQSHLQARACQLTLTNLTFTDNVAHDAAILIGANTLLTAQSALEFCLFRRNAKSAIALQYESGSLSISHSEFRENAHSITFQHKSFTSVPLLHLESSQFLSNLGTAVLTLASPAGTELFARLLNFADNRDSSVALARTRGTIVESAFTNNSADAGGAVLLQRESQVTVAQSTFACNSARGAGGAVAVAEGSRLECAFCGFNSNSAGSGGAVALSPGTAVSLSHSRFELNLAAGDGSAVHMLMTANSVIEDSLFQHNTAGGDATIVVIFSSLVLRNNTIQDNYCGKRSPGVVLSLANLTVSSTAFRSHAGSVGAFVLATMNSIVSIADSEFAYGDYASGGIYADDSAVDIVQTAFRSLTADYGSSVSILGDSFLNLTDCDISAQSNNRGGAVQVLYSYCRLTGTRFSTVTGSSLFAKGAKIVVTNSSFRGMVHVDNEATLGSGVYCELCQQVEVAGSSFASSRASSGAGVYLSHRSANSTFTVTHTTFTNNRAGDSAALCAEDVLLKVANCSFVGNEAEERGGAVTLSGGSECEFTFIDNRFVGNRAGTSGGAIAWEGTTPAIVGNEFDGNQALYGPNISSFPTYLSTTNTSLPSVASGQVVYMRIIVDVKDHYGQLVLPANSTTATLSVLSGAEVFGPVTETAVNGQILFTKFTLVGLPRSNTTLHITSQQPPTDLKLAVSFRECEMGEFETKGRCVVCGPGTYSLAPSQACTNCEANADCQGSYFLIPRPGYWRSSVHSARLYQCPNAGACLGPPALAGTCAAGYTGNKCQTCAVNYVRYLKTHCQPCPSQTSTILQTLGLMLAAVLFCVMLVVTSIKSAYKEKSQVSLSLKILMNYLQLVMLMGTFNLSWPGLVKRLLSVQDSAGGFSEHVFAPGCLSTVYDESEDFYRKVVAMSFVPLGLLCLSSALWALWALFQRQASILRNELIGSATILFFLVHPNVVRVMFSALNCEEIDAGEYWIVGLQQRCWRGDHWKYAVAAAVPSILLWGVGVPALVLLLMFRQRKRLHRAQVRVRFGYLFNGYSPGKYYWEYIIIYRKLLIISFAVFLSRLPQVVPALASLAVLLVSFALQEAHKPFRQSAFNTLEQRSLLVSFVTLFCGLYFLFGGLQTAVESLFFAAIVGVNVLFLQYWVRASFATLAAKVIGRCVCWKKCVTVLGNKVVTRKQLRRIQELAETQYNLPLPASRKQLYMNKAHRQLGI